MFDPSMPDMPAGPEPVQPRKQLRIGDSGYAGGGPGGYSLHFVIVPEVMVAGVTAIVRELDRAMKKFPGNSVFRNRHEGYAIALEEIDEWWDAIKNNAHGHGKNQDIQEAVQVGAMILHYIKDFGND